jgi:tape measure domain-containing protein
VAGGAVVGEAIARLVTELDQSSLNSSLNVVSSSWEKTGSRIGEKFKNLGGGIQAAGQKVTGFGKTLTKATLPITAIATTGLIAGFNRLKGIDQAKAALRGLGHDTETIEAISANALAAVEGTAFGLADSMKVAASAVASGVEPGDALQRTLTLVGDAASIAGSDLGEMGAIFNKVAATGKVQGDVLNQLGSAGIPIIQLLASELGVSAEEVVKLASAGKIGFAEFQNAIESGMGGAAQESGKTFTGALANARAALGRLGARVLEPVFPVLVEQLDAAREALNGLAEPAAKVGEILAKVVAGAIEGFRSLPAPVKTALVAVAGIATVAGPVLIIVGKMTTMFGVLVAALGAISLPVVAVVAGLAALGAGLVLAWRNSEAFRTAITAVGAAIITAFRDQIIPGIQAFVGFLTTQVLPILQDTAKQVATALLPVFRPLAKFITGSVMPAFTKVAATVRKFWPEIQTVTRFGLRLIAAFVKMQATILGRVIPVVLRVAGLFVSALAANITTAIAVIGNIVRAVVTFVETVRTMGAAAKDAGDRVKARLEAMQASVESIVGKIGTALSGMFAPMVFAATAAVASVKSIVNGVIGSLNAVISGANKIPGTSIPTIPKLARGARSFAGGLALVGEQGPELVNLPRGSDVFNNARTRRALRGGATIGDGGATVVNLTQVYTGPSTSNGRLREIDWTLRYATRAAGTGRMPGLATA